MPDELEVEDGFRYHQFKVIDGKLDEILTKLGGSKTKMEDLLARMASLEEKVDKLLL